jgi:predicted histidine transporter YuiF (NhaC family)
LPLIPTSSRNTSSATILPDHVGFMDDPVVIPPLVVLARWLMIPFM